MTPGKAYLTSEEIRPLAARSDLMGVLLVGHAYGVIALALLVFSLWPNVLSFLLAVAVIGSRQLGLAILMHEAAHSALFKTRAANEWVGRFLCGAPILAEMLAYRHYHLTHHRNTQQEGDPDLVLSRPFPTTRASLVRKFLRDLTGQTGIKLLAGQIATHFRLAGDDEAKEAAEKGAQAFKGGGMIAPILSNLVLFGVLWAIGDWWWWLAFWFLPLVTWFQFVLRLRNIAEHGATEFTDNALQNVRTTQAGPLWGLFVAPYWVNYHLEHHLIMHVPCWNLPKLHALMLAKGHGPKMRVATDYWQVLREVGWSNRASV